MTPRLTLFPPVSHTRTLRGEVPLPGLPSPLPDIGHLFFRRSPSCAPLESADRDDIAPSWVAGEGTESLRGSSARGRGKGDSHHPHREARAGNGERPPCPRVGTAGLARAISLLLPPQGLLSCSVAPSLRVGAGGLRSSQRRLERPALPCQDGVGRLLSSGPPAPHPKMGSLGTHKAQMCQTGWEGRQNRGGSAAKNLPAVQETRFDPWVGKIPGGGHGNPLQYSCLENPMDRGVWWATAHRVAKSRTRLKWLKHAPRQNRNPLPGIRPASLWAYASPIPICKMRELDQRHLAFSSNVKLGKGMRGPPRHPPAPGGQDWLFGPESISERCAMPGGSALGSVRFPHAPGHGRPLVSPFPPCSHLLESRLGRFVK